MNLGVAAAVFAFVAVAELPDKTMIATLVMGARARPLYVWLGAAGAFCVHVALAVLAGGLLALLPHTALEIVVAVLFAAGAAYLLFVPERAQVERGTEVGELERPGTATKVVATAFVVIFLGEFGDLTQVLIVNFMARTHQAAAVFVGGLAALLTVSALSAFGGRALLRVVPLAVVRRVGGVVLLGLAAWTLYDLVS